MPERSRQSRWAKRIAAILIAFAIVGVGIVLGLGWFIAPRDNLQKSDAIVVVSGGETATRVDTGITLWRDNWAPKLFFAGAAADRGVSNARVMQQRALRAGVPISATIIEEQSQSTTENARFLRPAFAAQNIRSAILVTSPYHSRRVKVTFERALPGVEFTVYPATDSRWARSSWWQRPDTIRLTLGETGKTFYAAFIE